MPLANYWNFLKHLRRSPSGFRPVRRPDRALRQNLTATASVESLEVRIVPSALPALSITPTVTVAEGDSDTTDAVFTVTLSAASTVPVTVQYGMMDGTANGDNDYIPQLETLTFAPGETTKTITVEVEGDTVHEADETFSVVLFDPTNAKLRERDSTGVATITNDDDAPTISIATPSIVFEGDSGTKTITFPVTLSNASSQAVTVHFATADGTATVADSDYNAASGTLTFSPGETTKNITVVIKGDTKDESDETFTVTLSTPSTSTTITTATATGTIGDDDILPAISVNTPSAIDEGNAGTSTLLFTVTLSSASTQTVTVAYATADGTATIVGNDYTATSGTLTFAPGETTKTISVVVKGDTLNEANETILLNLSGATNAIVATPTGTARITNDDVTLPNISITEGVTVTEGNTGMVEVTFHVTLSQASGQTVTVAIATADGTAKLADDDYVQGTGTITFAPGETDKTFVVQVKGDTKREGNETFSVNLTNPTNGVITTASRTGTITNDDDGQVSIVKTTDGAETTPASKGKFTVTQSGVSAVDTVVTYTIAGTATPGEGHDYQTLTGTVTIPAGQTSAVIDVTPLTDSEDEDTETVIVTLTGVTTTDTHIMLDPDAADLTATVNILDASDAPGLEVGGPAVTYTKGQKPIKVLPQVIVNPGSPAGGTLAISVNVISTSKKLLDKIKFPDGSSLGTVTGPQLVNNQLVLLIDLNQTATAAAIQTFLRGITFSTKKAGLQTATRLVNVTLTDAANHVSAITQTINVHLSNTP